MASARVPLLTLSLLVALAHPAAAHRQGAPGSTAGLVIPAVTHGQMTVLAEHRTAILALAETHDAADRTLRRLLGYVALQHFACGWGLFPGSEAESSPFNECRHGELAGLRAVLLRLAAVEPGDERVLSLSRRVEIQMLEHHAALVLCRYSEESFNTADVVFPNLGKATRDPPSLTCVALMTVAASGFAGRRARFFKKRPAVQPATYRS